MLKAGNFLVNALHDCVKVHSVDYSHRILTGKLKKRKADSTRRDGEAGNHSEDQLADKAYFVVNLL
jgi:hypothetical protein